MAKTRQKKRKIVTKSSIQDKDEDKEEPSQVVKDLTPEDLTREDKKIYDSFLNNLNADYNDCLNTIQRGMSDYTGDHGCYESRGLQRCFFFVGKN